MSGSAPFCIELQPASKADKLREDPQVFAMVRFTQESRVDSQRPGYIDIAMPPANTDELIEVWRTEHELQPGQHDQTHYLYCDDFLFGSLFIPEQAFEDIADATAHAYQQIHDTLEQAGFPALLRMWNYFPRINEESDGLERYHSFCMGRHTALEAWHFPEEQLPAASAIGTLSDGMVIYFIAGKAPGMQIENPRQVSAFHYPPQYGPKSPSFSRATLMKDWGHLYISGTASIVGHETRHQEDARAQLEETLVNLDAIIEQANARQELACKTIADFQLIRVYLRDPANRALVSEVLEERFGPSLRYQLVQGDICRSDLMLEIEGMYAQC
jgi:chorismate lyase/3-hydroxybenzoate synthase